MSHENQPAGLLSTIGSFLGISSSANKYVVRVKTRDVKYAGTDNSVRCAFIARDGERTNDFLLDKTFVNDLEHGEEDVFEFFEDNDIGEIDCIELWMDSNSDAEDKWFCEYIIVSYHKECCEDTISYPFPLHRWIKSNKRYEFQVYDSCLPQEETSRRRKQQRMDEIAERKIEYKHKDDPGMPATTATLPDAEVFSNDYMWDIGKRILKLRVAARIHDMFGSDEYESFEDMKSIYGRSFDIPASWDNWKYDYKFGDQRLNGCNTNQIKRCDKIPENFPVTDEMVVTFLDGLTLENAMKEKRLYIVDLKALKNIPYTNESSPLCCPLALFFRNDNGELLPIAIQLFQEPSEDNPIFLPSDPGNKWLLVKMFFNNADSQIQQACTHLGYTHLLCEGIASAAAQSMSPSHPVNHILSPHFLYLFAINHKGLHELLAPGFFFDLCATVGVKGLLELIKQRWTNWRMDQDGWYPADIEARGVADKEALANYHARDDQLALHEAIWKYVRDLLLLVYDCPEKLKQDSEVQEFGRLLVDKDAIGMKGVFGGGKFDDVEDLVKVVTSIIFTASVGHAVANFSQYDEYAFTPCYPAILNGDVPKDKSEITVKDIINSLPDKDKTLYIVMMVQVLSERSTQPLGDFEIQYLYKPKYREAVKRFQENLKEIGEKIDARNKDLKTPYTYLHPKEIPNAISI